MVSESIVKTRPSATMGEAMTRSSSSEPLPALLRQARPGASAVNVWCMAWLAKPPACGHSVLIIGAGSTMCAEAACGSGTSVLSCNRTEIRSPGNGAASFSPNHVSQAASSSPASRAKAIGRMVLSSLTFAPPLPAYLPSAASISPALARTPDGAEVSSESRLKA